MAVEIFSKEEFEEQLDLISDNWEPVGLVDGEFTYRIPVDDKVSIMVRSSVRHYGRSADTGDDSIRPWLVDRDDRSIGSKLGKWVQRKPGWEERLGKKVKELTELRSKAGDCSQCGNPKRILRVRKNNKNKNRMFANCNCNRHDEYQWLEEKVNGTSKLLEMAKRPLEAKFADDEVEVLPSIRHTVEPNKMQMQAITAPIDANVRVFAGPGTGKTEALSRRYEYLYQNGIHPDNVLVLTFTKDMANEMGQRIYFVVPQINFDQSSTVHAFCYRELTINNVELEYHGWRYPGPYAPLQSWEVKMELERLIGRYWPQSEDDKPGYKEVLNWIDTSKYLGITLSDCRQWFVNSLGAWFGIPLSKIRIDFDNWLYGYKCLMFSDMLFLMEQELANNPQFKAKLQRKYSHIIIDESQDTNYQAFRILFHILEEAKLFLVGDVNQMMFRFQGAKPELITDGIADLENLQTILFDQNYRSHDEIITAFQNLISHNYSDTGGPYDQQFFQPIQGTKGVGGKVSFEMAFDVFEESAKVANEIAILLENGSYEAGHFFVGARTKAQLGYLEGELIKKGIKYINIAGGSFWNGKHVRNVISYLALAHNTRDTVALSRVVNIASINHTYKKTRGNNKAGDYCPVRFLGKKFLDYIDGDFEKIDKFMATYREPWRFKHGVADLQDFVWSLNDAAKNVSNVGQLVDIILEDCYTKWLKATEGVDDEESNIIDNLRTVADVAAQYTSIEEFLAYVEDMIEAAQKMKDKEWDEYVVISTYHRLKGLERKVIFGMGWCEGEDKYGNPAGLLPHTFSLIDPPQFGVLPAGRKSPVEDERCIAFVCVSRAMERVYLSGCSEYRSATMGPSRFVGELVGE